VSVVRLTGEGYTAVDERGYWIKAEATSIEKPDC
jgi:hypothetical protein